MIRLAKAMAVDPGDQRRTKQLGRILRALGYVKKPARDTDGKLAKLWGTAEEAAEPAAVAAPRIKSTKRGRATR
jgi:hypothetical protein